MDMSLDEIIAKRKLPKKTVKKGFIGKNFQKQDARNLIIQKNRHKIRDARDKLVEKTRSIGDARDRILIKTKGSIPTRVLDVRKSFPPINRRRPMPRERGFLPKPRGYVDYDNMEHQEKEEIAGLRRTIQNDLLPRGRGPHTAFPDLPFRDRRTELEPFAIYNVPRRSLGDKPLPPRGNNLMDVDMEDDFPLDIHRSLRNREKDPIEYSHLSVDMKHRLQNPPEYGGSHGIFSNPLKKTMPMPPEVSPQEYRIVVSNLHPSVTESDIQELFQEIGELLDARLVKTGVAEVIFKRLKDALKAVEVYHNRQLDSMPMKCLLVNPRASDHPTAPALSSSGSHRSKPKSSFEVDIDALHKVLFRSHQ